MGDPKKPKKQYKTPRHPWEKDRIDAEKVLMKEFGLLNKKEIWRFNTKLADFKSQAKKVATITTDQLAKEKQQLFDKLQRLGLLGDKATLADVLGLSVNDLLERRLQTLVFKRKLANTVKQARQFIIHGHVTVNSKVVTVPSYMVPKELESKITILIENGTAEKAGA